MEQLKSNLIVNYVPNDVTDVEFKEMFAPFGPTSTCKLIKDRNTGISLGFGFVKYETDENASAAIAALNGKPLKNKRMKVSVARPEGQKAEKCELYVTNLPKTMTQEQVQNLFAVHGIVHEVKVFTDRTTGESRGVAFVRMASMAAASASMRGLTGTKIPGAEKPLEIKEFVSRSRQVLGAHHQLLPLQYGGFMQQPVFGYGPSGRGNSYGQNRYSPMSGGGGPRGAPDDPGMGGPMGQMMFPGYSPYPMQPSGFGGPSSPLEGEPSSTVFVFHLPVTCTEETLERLFLPFAVNGMMNGVTIVRNRADGSSRGFAFVNYNTIPEATAAIEGMNGYQIGNKYLKCSYKK